MKVSIKTIKTWAVAVLLVLFFAITTTWIDGPTGTRNFISATEFFLAALTFAHFVGGIIFVINSVIQDN